jgi:hypothetical protein
VNARERKYVMMLVRRRDRLHEIVADWQGKPGGEDRSRAELAALDWALKVVQNADEDGTLDELTGRPQQKPLVWMKNVAWKAKSG